MKRLLFLLILTLSLVAEAQTPDEVANPLKGKIINVIGDSYVRNHRRPVGEAWHSLVAERNGMVYRNYGRNGGCIVFDREKEGFGREMLERYKEMNDTADYVLVIAGHNDAFFVGSGREQEFRDGLRRFCQLLTEKYPKAAIGFVTPWDVPRDGFAEVNRALREICAEFSIPVLNAAEVGGIDVRNDDFRKQFFQGPNDTAHLNARGHELFYPTGLEFIRSLKPRQAQGEMWIECGTQRIFGVLSKPASKREQSNSFELPSESRLGKGKPENPNNEKQPIAIIAHGFNGTHEYGKNYFESFNRLGYQFFTFDFPCGSVNSKSDPNTLNMSVIDEQMYLEAVIRHFKQQPDVDPERVVLIGESQGGLVAALAAANSANEISRLILVFPALCIPDNWNSRYKEIADIPDETALWNVKLGRRFFTELRYLRPFDIIGQFAGPVQIIQGDKDPIVPVCDSQRAVEIYKDARLHIIPGAGHGFKPAEFKESLEVIEEFLK